MSTTRAPCAVRAFVALVGVAEGGDRGDEAGLDRGLGERHAQRRPPGRADADAGAAERRSHEFRPAVVAVGAAQPERRDRADDAAAEAGQAIRIEAPRLVAAWFEVEDEGVGADHQLAEAGGVARDLAGLALVEEVEGGGGAAGVPIVAAGAVAAQRVALGWLDLHEVRAEAAQQLAGVGGGPALAQLDDAQPADRQVEPRQVRH